MNQPPLILVTASLEERGMEFADTSLSLSNRYPAAIADAGGLPWVMPCLFDKDFVATCVRRCAGVLLTGGDDIQPKLYGAKLTPKLKRTVTVADPKRDLLELLVIQEVFRQRKPLLAICRGHQLLNVALGGGLVVDIPLQRPKALRHNRTDMKDKLVHPVSVASGSRLEAIFKRREIGVNSTHHQAVEQVAAPLRATAVSQDGIVEGMELQPEANSLLPFLVSVQFHPERLVEGFPEFRGLFANFIRACQPPQRRSP